jgi:hypothetical protein
MDLQLWKLLWEDFESFSKSLWKKFDKSYKVPPPKHGILNQ